METASRAGDFDVFTDADVRFHSALLRASGNSVVTFGGPCRYL
jgi:DNA-binding FadR family transcriptional regulator